MIEQTGTELEPGREVDSEIRSADRARQFEIRTPTGHRYRSEPPPALGPGGNYAERRRRTAQRRIAYLEREHLIASLPSPGASVEADPRPSEPA